jgi:hypothetical protein
MVSMRFDCSEAGGDCCELAGPAIAVVASAVKTSICLNIAPLLLVWKLDRHDVRTGRHLNLEAGPAHTARIKP